MSVLLSITKLDTLCRDANGVGWFGNYKCIDSGDLVIYATGLTLVTWATATHCFQIFKKTYFYKIKKPNHLDSRCIVHLLIVP